MSAFVDIHCHLLPGVDDGAADVSESLAMARMTVEQGVEAVIATPHQLGCFAHNRGADLLHATTQLQATFDQEKIPLTLMPGAEVRIEEGMLSKLLDGELLTLGNHGRHVLIELPFEVYLPLDPVLDALEQQGMVGILAHPERYATLQQRPDLVEALVDRGCLMQVTTGSFVDAFGPQCQSLAERMATRGLVHFLSTDAHGARSRRPRIRDGFEAAAAIAGHEAATKWCSENPRAVFEGREVAPGRVEVARARRSGWSLWRRQSA